ncbi:MULTISPECIES: hypothetical protein [Caballeronia]|uniref:Uncharacterized protein n=1 Tax=Caballeronia cordobensis TaxID=1353886 RepID=A0A158JQ77_CABCO|nr:MULTISPECIES: hypothetical protein [Caballeronia]AQH01783.1 hypothetical protein A9R05_23700 [Burkholderia sp. KK1]BAO89517.1 hypothetical protein BRPE67_BCDS16030 [Burkholderia sp. RPE67]BBP97885.1 hypothetical protein BSFA1_30140 [Burkholderia sp. SFA1]MCE4545237.1 hypothetical protein [Caballeronia sp. PC1]MCE4570663.1 hypothetical protein [Caballeronia sp. CLC5]
MRAEHTAIYIGDWATYVFIAVLASAAFAMFCSMISMYMDLWRFDEKGELLPPQSMFPFLRSTWFIHLNTWLALTSALALVVLL